MNDWLARYEEGYITIAGMHIPLASELHEQHPWSSPEAALAHWRARPDLAGSDVRPYKNGLEQLVSVVDHPGFSAVDVVAIWRRVTFLRRAESSATVVPSHEGEVSFVPSSPVQVQAKGTAEGLGDSSR